MFCEVPQKLGKFARFARRGCHWAVRSPTTPLLFLCSCAMLTRCPSVPLLFYVLYSFTTLFSPPLIITHKSPPFLLFMCHAHPQCFTFPLRLCATCVLCSFTPLPSPHVCVMHTHTHTHTHNTPCSCAMLIFHCSRSLLCVLAGLHI